jgi:hypothetical protein
MERIGHRRPRLTCRASICPPELYWKVTSPAHVKGLALEVSEAIRAGTRAKVWVTPVIVVWGEFPQVVAGDTCKFVHGDALARWLRDQPARISPDRVEQFAETVATALADLDVTQPLSRWTAGTIVWNGRGKHPL